ncbi:MAG TPA: toll/interleukin-1 receptor domain-containing protein [Tepidisphaeraceae bacterium]|nr:toll/interleukin-1 receptor domain-containing protein [Tepidisphaeraceae bacterium]HUB26618.1 toll/interleukin-1 receptor domain-containing protein [Tepidisphaeraceae bacterium]
MSFALRDRRLAIKVAHILSESGLNVVRPDELEPGGEYSAAVRDAMRRSAAMVVVLSQAAIESEQIPSSVLFEIGAGFGAEKPIFVVTDNPGAKLPFGTPKLRILPASRVEEIADELLARS